MLQRSLLIATLALCAFVFVAGCKKEGETFTQKPPAVGTSLKEQQEVATQMTLTLDMTAAGGPKQSNEIAKTESAVMTKEVLEVKDGAPVKMKVSYEKKSISEKAQGQVQEGSSPVAGKTFIATLVDGRVQVTDAEGKPVPEDVAGQVAYDNNDLGKASHFVVKMPDRPLKKGDEVPELAKMIQDEMIAGVPPNQPAPTFKDVSVKLREVKEGVAIFDVKLGVAQSQDGKAMNMELSGTYSVRTADSRPAGMSLEGPVKISASQEGGGGKVVMEGAGTMKIQRTVTYPGS